MNKAFPIYFRHHEQKTIILQDNVSRTTDSFQNMRCPLLILNLKQ